MFNFKNVGNLKTSHQMTNINKSSIKINPVGILSPLMLNSSETDVNVSNSPEVQIKDNIKNFLLTNKGERLGRYRFGADLRNFLFDVSNIKKYESALTENIENELTSNFPMIKLESVDVLTSLSERNETTFKKGLDKLAYRTIESVNSNVISDIDKTPGMMALLVTVKYTIPKIRVVNQGIQIKMLIGG